eukprot:g74474.t1
MCSGITTASEALDPGSNPAQSAAVQFKVQAGSFSVHDSLACYLCFFLLVSKGHPEMAKKNRDHIVSLSSFAVGCSLAQSAAVQFMDSKQISEKKRKKKGEHGANSCSFNVGKLCVQNHATVHDGYVTAPFYLAARPNLPGFSTTLVPLYCRSSSAST